MTDIKQDVKVFVKVFIQVFVSNIVKESTKKMIKSLSQRQRKLLEAKSKKMSDDQIVQYLDKSSFFKKTMENSVKSVCDLSSSKGTVSFVGKLESIYETTGYVNNPIYGLILPASKTVLTTAGTAAVATAVVIAITNPAPIADFTSDVTNGSAPLTVNFTDHSQNATEWNWDFGDGNYSFEENTTHTYYKAGDYTVKLKVSNENGTDSKSVKIKVLQPVVLPVLPVANFSSDVTTDYPPLTVQFQDLSQNATEWYWDFGDGNNSREKSPKHTYYVAGNYNVNLAASNVNGTDLESVLITVLGPDILPIANFSRNVTSGSFPLSVQFTDNSQNANELYWNFGDGKYSTRQNITHTYFAAGNYTVNLTASNENGTNSKLSTINVLKSIPVITWSNPADIIYETILNNTQLNASASVKGSFVYTPSSGTILNAGTHTLHVDFTPDDIANYKNTSSNVTLNITKAVPVITWITPARFVYGTKLGSTQLNASASVPGTYVYTPKAGTVLGAGTHTLRVNFTPSDASNYTGVSKNVKISITKATPVITWNNPADIIYGTALDSVQLDASASVPGTYVYTPKAGIVLNTGTRTLSVNFIPADDSNYTSTSADVTINVLKATGTFAYITNHDSNTVSVIDTATNTITDTVPVGKLPNGVAVNPEGTKVYVTNEGSNTISVIDTATNTVDAIEDVNSPWGVAVNPEGTKIYATNYYSNSISVIDTVTNTVAAKVPVGVHPRGVAVTPDETKVYVANFDSSNVSVIDTATNQVISTINIGVNPEGVAIDPEGKKVYVASLFHSTIYVIDTTTDNVTAMVGVEYGPVGVSVNPDGTKVYVANWASNTVSLIDTATNTVTTTIPVGEKPWGVSVSPDGAKVYVANVGSDTVSVIDTATNDVIDTITVGNGPAALGQFIGTIHTEPLLPAEI